jgi:phosphatidyl-myo-inositol dimannoside synthase
MKILALMPDAYGGFGGIAQYNRDLIDALSDSSRVSVIHSLARNPFDTPFELPAKVTEQVLSGRGLRYLAAATRQALKLRPDIILCGHINLLPIAAFLKRITGRPLILEAYGIDAWHRREGLRAWGINQVDLVLAISRFTREKLIEWSGLAPHLIKVVPNAVHLNRYSRSEKPERLVNRYGLKGRRVLLTIARLAASERYKGLDRIISLLPRLTARFPDLVYLIGGDGDDLLRLEALAKSSGNQERVVFAGRIREEEKVDHYNLADAFAMPSIREGFGFVFLEAAACGLPVLGGSRDGSRDALVEGRLGVMIDPTDSEQLLGGLMEILAKEKSVPDVIKPFDFPRFKSQVEALVTNVPIYSR